MNIGTILTHTRTLSSAYQSDPKHQTPEALKAKTQMQQLTVTERKLLKTILQSTYDKKVKAPADDDTEVIKLADRIVAIQQPGYQSTRTKTKLASFSRSLKNLWKRPSTESVFKEAKKIPSELNLSSISAEKSQGTQNINPPASDPPPSPPPSDIPPLPPITTEAEEKDSHQVYNNASDALKNLTELKLPLNDEEIQKNVDDFIGKFVKFYSSKEDETIKELSAKIFNSQLKKFYPGKTQDELYENIRNKFKDDAYAVNYLESNWNF